jgi:capsular exopolysaccharide synthesis family protein
MSDLIHKNGKRGSERSRFEYVQSYSVRNESSAGSVSDTLDPKKIVFTLLRYKWLLLVCISLGAAIAWFYADTITPTYESSGTMLINTGSAAGDELSEIISQTTGMRTGSTLANELQVLLSRDFARLIAEKVIEEEPGDHTTFPILWNVDESGTVSRAGNEAVTNRIRRNLSAIQPERESDVVELIFTSASPEESAYIVNSALDIYVDRSTLLNRSAAESTAEYLQGEMESLRQNLENAERQLKDYMDRTGIVAVDEQATGIVNEQVTLETEIQQVNLELRTTNESIANLENQLNRIKPGLSEDFSQAIGPRVRNAQELLARHETERTMIISRNPGVLDRDPLPSRIVFLDDQILKLKEEIRGLSAQLFTEDDEFMGMDTADRAELVSSIQSNLVELNIQQNQYQSRRDALTERKAEIERRFNNLPDGMIELSRLQRDVRMNEELYVNVSRQYADMSVLKQSQFGFGRILDEALVPSFPVSPNKILMLIIGVVLGGMFAVGFLLIRDFMDNSINSVDLLKEFPIPLLSAVPVINKIPDRKKKRFETNSFKVPDALVLHRDKGHIVSESIRRLKNNLIYQFGHTPPKTIAITSAEKGDGKTTIAANLGIAFADEGFKTLIVDTDFRRSNLHKYFGIRNEGGLSDYLKGNVQLINLIKNTDLSHLKIAPAGSPPTAPETIVNSKEFKKFREKMEELFDVIIFDTPPYGIISDSSGLLKSVEATVLTTRFRKTNRGIFVKTLEELDRIDANVAGIVLNAFNHKHEVGTKYGPGYYQALYSNYEAYVEGE